MSENKEILGADATGELPIIYKFSKHFDELEIRGIQIVEEKDILLPVVSGGTAKLSDVNLGKIYEVKVSKSKSVIATSSTFASRFASEADDDDVMTFKVPLIMKDQNTRYPIKEISWLFSEACGDIIFDKTTVGEDLKKNLIDGISEAKGVLSKSDYVAMSSLVAGAEDSDKVLTEVMNDLYGALSAASGIAAKCEAVVASNKELKASLSLSAIRSGGGSMHDFIDRYAFKKHIKVVGKAGVGKTYGVDKFAEESGHEYEFIAGHSGLESIDLLGYYTKDAAGNMVWMDGALAAAFRKAAHKDTSGNYDQKCILVIDELLRIPARELSICVGSLTPSSKGTYKLRTNRIVGEVDGVGEAELLECPVENLWVVATTNIGADFDVENIDTALDDRFRTIDVEMDNATFRSIIEKVDDENNKLGVDVIDNFMKLKDAIHLAYADQNLKNTLSLRHVTEVLQYCKDKKQLFTYIFDLKNQICARNTTGIINDVQEKVFKDTIRKNFRK